MTAEKLKALPAGCAVYIPGNRPGNRIGYVRRGEKGYYTCKYDHADWTDEQCEAEVRSINETYGIDAAQEQAMRCGSMFGWHVPGADPERYRNAQRN